MEGQNAFRVTGKSYHPRPRADRRHGAWTAVLPLLLLATLAVAAPRYQGRLLVDVLEEMRNGGLRLIYSSALVRGDLRVATEPASTDPREILEEILPPLGLEVRDGPAGALLIVAASPEALSGRIGGRVLSAAQGVPIARATVTVKQTGAGAVTRPDGSFEIAGLPAGDYDVHVDALGFLSASYTRVRVAPGGRVNLSVRLESQPSYAAGITVTPGHRAVLRQEQDPRHTVEKDDAVLVPNIGGDISRVVELLPGVAAADNSAAFNLRGSQSRDVAIVLDGLELYDPFHLLKFQSPFTFVDGEIVDTIDLVGGGFTADRGDRHGGFVEMTTAPPRDTPVTGIEIGSLNSRVSYSTPLPRGGGSWMVSARTWYPEALRNTIEFGARNINPRFGDLYSKASFNLSPETILSVHGLVAYDRLEYRESGGGEKVNASDSSGYLWTNLARSWSPELSSQSVISVGRASRLRRGISEPVVTQELVSDDRSVNFLGFKHDLTWQISGTQLLRAGLDLRRQWAEYHYDLDTGVAGQPTIEYSLDPAGTSYAAYVSQRFVLSPRLAVEGGLRWDKQSYLGDSQLSPRLNSLWRFTDRSSLRLAVGSYYQSQRINELQLEDGETMFHRAELSRQVELALDHRFSDGSNIRLDGYYRRLSHLQPRYENLFNPIELFPETESDRALVDADRARLRGAELLFRSPPARPLSWWVSYTWSSADDIIDGVAVARRWDQTHAGRFLVAWHAPDDLWLVSLAGSAHTGWPKTPVSAEIETLPGGATRVVAVPGDRNSERLPGYLRFDLKATRSFELGRARMKLELDIVNLTDRKNVCCVSDIALGTGSDGTPFAREELGRWLGVTPSFSVLVEF